MWGEITSRGGGDSNGGHGRGRVVVEEEVCRRYESAIPKSSELATLRITLVAVELCENS